MNKKTNKPILLFATFFLVLCSFLAVNSNNVSAKSWYWWAKKPRTIVLTRPRYIYEIQGTTPRYKNYMIRKKLLKAGTTMKIQHVASYDWVITKPGYANGYFKVNKKFWIIPESKNIWKDRYEKYKWIDKGLLDGQFKDEHFSYKFTWKQFRKLCSLNVLNNNYFVTKKDWRTKIRPLIDKWKPETEKD